MWNKYWRDSAWQKCSQAWDVIIIGGGITGAGIFRMAAQSGLRPLLLDANDFSFGTSSRSSKLVHGGFRYLRNRQWSVTYESVGERERMLREARNLVTPLKFVIPCRESDHTPAKVFGLGVAIYDLMAPKWTHRKLTPAQLLQMAPQLNPEGLVCGYEYGDALTDDARLVLRILREGVRLGGTALNYAAVENLLRDVTGKVRGVLVRDRSPEGRGHTVEVMAHAVINATGPWVDELRAQVGGAPLVRKSRGSHILFPWQKFPIQQAFTLLHPRDNRAFFAIPWEGMTLVGTTDLDHPAELEARQPEPSITAEEVDYLMEAVQASFPALELTRQDITSTFAGLRPLVQSPEASNPSAVSRKHVLLKEDDLVTITGGKLTTFRRMAWQTLEAVRPRFAGKACMNWMKANFNPPPEFVPETAIEPGLLKRLVGRYGDEVIYLLESARADELKPFDCLTTLWAELRWAAREEGVVHLDDLLLRRTRLGLLAEQGGLPDLPAIRAEVQPELGWDDARWEAEAGRYQDLWKSCYYLPEE